MALFLRAAFVDINIDKSRSVYYYLDRELAVEYASVSRGFYEKRVYRHN